MGAGTKGNQGGSTKGAGKRKRDTVYCDDRGVPQPGNPDYRFYASKQYWDARYTSGKDPKNAEPYEWFCSLDDIMPLVQSLVRPEDAVLDVGCGTSGLLGALHAAGHRGRLVGLDYSEAALAGLRAASSSSSAAAPQEGAGPPEYFCLDARRASGLLGAGSVDSAVEKGTLAGIFSAPAGAAVGAAVLRDLALVIREGGLLLSLSPHDPHDPREGCNGLNVLQELVLPPLMEAGHEGGHWWSVEVHSSDAFPSVHAYALRKHKRRSTRAASRGEEAPVIIKCLQH